MMKKCRGIRRPELDLISVPEEPSSAMQENWSQETIRSCCSPDVRSLDAALAETQNDLLWKKLREEPSEVEESEDDDDDGCCITLSPMSSLSGGGSTPGSSQDNNERGSPVPQSQRTTMYLVCCGKSIIGAQCECFRFSSNDNKCRHLCCKFCGMSSPVDHVDCVQFKEVCIF